MPLFQPSTVTFASAQEYVADSASVSGDSEMLARAARAIRSAFERWNTGEPWMWTRTVTSVTASAGNPTATLPSDIRKIYSVRTTGADPRTLYYISARDHDRLIPDQTETGQITHYDLFRQGTEGKIQFILTPSDDTPVSIKYYRRLTVPVTASGSAPLDCPEDYEWDILALARGHFLIDKGMTERAMFWINLGNEGYARAVADNHRIPDAMPAFRPGDDMYPALSPNSLLWGYIDW